MGQNDIDFNHIINEALRAYLEGIAKNEDIIFTENKHIYGREGLKPREPNITKTEHLLSVYLNIDGSLLDGFLSMNRTFISLKNEQLQDNGFPKEEIIEEYRQLNKDSNVMPSNETARTYSLYIRNEEKHFEKTDLEQDTIDLLNELYSTLKIDFERNYDNPLNRETEPVLKHILEESLGNSVEENHISLVKIRNNAKERESDID